VFSNDKKCNKKLGSFQFLHEGKGEIIGMCKYVNSFQCIQQFSWLAIIVLLFAKVVNKKGCKSGQWDGFKVMRGEEEILPADKTSHASPGS